MSEPIQTYLDRLMTEADYERIASRMDAVREHVESNDRKIKRTAVFNRPKSEMMKVQSALNLIPLLMEAVGEVEPLIAEAQVLRGAVMSLSETMLQTLSELEQRVIDGEVSPLVVEELVVLIPVFMASLSQGK